MGTSARALRAFAGLAVAVAALLDASMAADATAAMEAAVTAALEYELGASSSTVLGDCVDAAAVAAATTADAVVLGARWRGCSGPLMP